MWVLRKYKVENSTPRAKRVVNMKPTAASDWTWNILTKTWVLNIVKRAVKTAAIKNPTVEKGLSPNETKMSPVTTMPSKIVWERELIKRVILFTTRNRPDKTEAVPIPAKAIKATSSSTRLSVGMNPKSHKSALLSNKKIVPKKSWFQ
jgi:hypothetical protein